MARKVDVGGQTIQTETGGSFAPLPAGKYAATIFGVKEDTFKSGKNKGFPILNVQFRISDGQKGANRRIFDRIPLKPKFAEDKDAFRFFQFWAAVKGIPEKEFRVAVAAAAENKKGSIELADDKDLLGEEVTLVLGIEDDDYHFKEAYGAWESLPDDERLNTPEPVIADFQRNKVSNILVKGQGNMAGTSGSAKADVSKAVQLDEFTL